MRRFHALTGLAVILTLWTAPSAAEAETCSGRFDQDHAVWDGIVSRSVKGGSVDYRGLQAGGRQELKVYLDSLERVCRSEYEGWSDRAKLAFWINTYNAFTVELILDSAPVESIMTIGDSRGAAFKRPLIPFEAIEGRRLSLDDVENRIIRPRFRDPRIHFALNCASVSCPPLRAEAYTASKLDRQLDSQTRAFIGDERMNRYDAASHRLLLSRIFDWYGEDFRRGGGSVASFVGRHLGGEAAAAIAARPPAIDYLEYDWSLNGR